MSGPVYILVGGVGHTPVFFEALIAELANFHVKCTAVDLPTVGWNAQGTTQQDEIRAIREAVLQYIDQEKRDVVLVSHSYGGWPASRAVKGLDKETRLRAGQSTGIVELIFISAFLVPDRAPVGLYARSPPWLTHKNGARIPNEDSIPVLFNDLDREAQQYWLRQFRPQQNGFVGDVSKDAPWHLSVPKTYILTTGETSSTLAVQMAMLQSVIDDTWSVKSIKTGHEPFISQPLKLAEILLSN